MASVSEPFYPCFPKLFGSDFEVGILLITVADAVLFKPINDVYLNVVCVLCLLIGESDLSNICLIEVSMSVQVLTCTSNLNLCLTAGWCSVA